MFEFLNYSEIALTLTFFIITIYLEKDSKKKSYVLIIITGLMFLYTLFVMPMTQKTKADESTASFKKGLPLSCTSGFLVFSSTFAIDYKQWDLEENYFIHKQTKESIRADKCISIDLSR